MALGDLHSVVPPQHSYVVLLSFSANYCPYYIHISWLLAESIPAGRVLRITQCSLTPWRRTQPTLRAEPVGSASAAPFPFPILGYRIRSNKLHTDTAYGVHKAEPVPRITGQYYMYSHEGSMSHTPTAHPSGQWSILGSSIIRSSVFIRHRRSISLFCFIYLRLL